MDLLSLLNSLNPGSGPAGTPPTDPKAVAALAATTAAGTSLAATNLANANPGQGTALANPGTAVAGPGIPSPGIGAAGLAANTGVALTNLPVISVATDVYHGEEAPTTASLLAQNGVGAYVQLLNVLATGELDAKSTALLVNNLAKATQTLRSAYEAAVARLPAPLQQKDWAFSVIDDILVFTQGANKLSPQDFTDLRQAFSGTTVEPEARQLIAVLTAMESGRKSDVDANSLASSRAEVLEPNFDDVDLRAYITVTAPGGKYTPTATEPLDYSRLPAILGGLNLTGLMSARPDSLHAQDPSLQDALAAAAAIPEKLEVGGTLHGQCSCGEVRFTVEDAFAYAFYCHCSRCRRRTGSAFAAIAGINIEHVQVTTGREHLLIEGECSDGYGARCSRCYTFLFAAVRGRQYMHVSLGTLVSTPGRSPDHHIYVGSKAPWHQITDALPQYHELP